MKELVLSYKQFCIFNVGLENPFNDWSDKQVQQGFSFRKGAMSIMTISNEGVLEINFLQEDKIIESAKRILEFEFIIEKKGLEIATITDSFQLKLKKGRYKIRVQLFSEAEGKDICYISFFLIQQNEELPKYLKYDDEITKVTDFDLEGKAAI